MIFLNNLFEISITTKTFEIINKTFIIIKTNEIFNIVENVEKSLFKDFKYKKDFI